MFLTMYICATCTRNSVCVKVGERESSNVWAALVNVSDHRIVHVREANTHINTLNTNMKCYFQFVVEIIEEYARKQPKNHHQNI